MSESNILGDLMKDLKGAWGTRISNPLTGAFAISWLAVNYRLLVVLISSSPFVDKFSHIDKVLYPNLTAFLLKCVVLPLAFALFYIYLLPVPTEKVYRWTLDRQRRLNNIAREVAGERLLSADEARAILKEVESERAKSSDQLRQSEENAESLRRENMRMDKDMHAEREQAARELQGAEEERRNSVAEGARRLAEMSWALTWEQAVGISYAPSDQAVARLNRFLTAKEFAVTRSGQHLGNVRFRSGGTITHTPSGDLADWSHWRLQTDHRLLIMDGNDRQVAEFEWAPVSAKWNGTVDTWSATLSTDWPNLTGAHL